ncbi:MAG: primosomal protein N', partial [Eubacteriales bacterium]|nr:primosomal protein N' [Eubacteriales bacterium]
AETEIEMAVADICAFIPGGAGAVSALLKKGLLVESGHVTFRRPHDGAQEPQTGEVTPTPAQQAAIDTVIAGMERGGGTFLLHGVTGSGKTEVYLRCIRHCIDQGRQAIVLVPEIALTPQTVGRFRSRFGDSVAVLHSKLSAGERFDEWRRIRLGKVQVAVGARSAVFAPFSDIGLIVIDEEHEQSYQSENTPRYHAAEVALRRCAQANAPLVLGSATPSITSYHRAEQGRYQLIEMKERVEARPMPKVTVVDMREEFLAGNNGIFSAALVERLQACLQAKQQAILFINRRGYSTFVSCRGCGLVLECPNCDVSLTYHKTDGSIRCHYCGYTAKVPAVCPACGKPYLKYFGVGTQQVEEQLHELFPNVTSIRMDMDSTRTKDAHETLLSAFRRGEAQVLIGTQMVAKGLDFPNVTLVGVVAADSTLYIPDYRSAERTFELLTQVAGRAGRDAALGHVVIQTYSPEHPAIRFAKTHDFNGFYAHECKERQAALFPPFSLFVRVLFSGMEEEPLSQGCTRFAKGLNETLLQALGEKNAAQLLYLCASPAPVRRRQGVYRYQVLVKLLRTANTASALNAIYRYTAAHRTEAFTTLEVNPGDMF